MTPSKTLRQRLQAPTPRFYKNIRNAGLVLAAASAALLATPVALPAAVVQVAGYLAVAGSVATAVAQTTTGGRVKKKDGEELLVREDTHPGSNDNRSVLRGDTPHGNKGNNRKTKSRGQRPAA